MGNDPSDLPAKRRSSLVTEIYFSPISTDQDTVSLSSPLNSPLIIANRASFDSSRATVGEPQQKSEDSPNAQTSIKHFVTALIHSPLVQKHIKRQLIVPPKWTEPRSPSDDTPAGFTRWGSPVSIMSACVDRRSSLLFETTPVDDEVCTSTTTTLSTAEDRESLIPEEKLQELFGSMYATSFDVKAAPQTSLCGVHLIHHRPDGSKGIMTSQQPRPRDATIRAQLEADLSSITLPERTALGRSLFIVSNGKQKHVILRIVVQAVRRSRYDRTHVVVADIDMTESFTKAAVFEFLRVICESDHPSSGTPLLHTRDFVTTVNTLPRLSKDFCTMQTLTLLSEIDRITGQFMEFYVVQAKEMHDTGHPAIISVPWVSEGLWKASSGKDEEDLVEVVVEIVGKKSPGGGVFTSGWHWDGAKNRMVCVSMVRPGKEESTPREWICFARDGFDIGYW